MSTNTPSQIIHYSNTRRVFIACILESALCVIKLPDEIHTFVLQQIHKSLEKISFTNDSDRNDAGCD